LSGINRIDKLERDSRRFYYPIKPIRTFTDNTSNNGSTAEEKIVGKPVADMAVRGGDILVYNKRNKQWEPEFPIHPATIRGIDDAICHNNSVICHNEEILYL